MPSFPVSGLPLRRALLCASALYLVQTSIALADDFTIPSGTTVTTTQTLDTAGDVGRVEKGGRIEVTGGLDTRAINGAVDEVTVNNSGTVSGTATVSDSTANGIRAGSLNTIINSGTASATAANDRSSGHGIRVLNSNTVTNSGTASGTADGWSTAGYGIRAGNGNTITNSGTALGMARGFLETTGYGIYSLNGNTITNSGTVSGTATSIRSAGYGIFSFDGTTITNSGKVSGTAFGTAFGRGGNGYGIWARNGNTITNSGTIIGRGHTGSTAIWLDGSNNKVNLLAGSVLVGGVVFAGSGNKLNIGSGLNLYLKYENNDPTVTSAMPYVHDKAGNVVYTIDPSGLALSQSFIQTTAGAVHDAVRTGAGRGNALGGGFSGSGTYGYGSDEPGFDGTGRRFWASGFGGYQSQNGSGNIAGGDQAYGGLVTGGGFASQERMYGGFAGGAYSRLQTDNGTQAIDAASFVAGVYGGTRSGAAWISGSLLGGYTSFSSDRTVADNTAVGGLRTASADYDGYFISPSVTIGRSLGERTEVSIGGHYAGLFIDGYTETGLPTNMTVASRDVHVASLRAKAGYLALQHRTDNGTMSVETWAGVDGYFNLGGGDVSASVAGLPFDAFSANFKDTTAAGFAGIGINSKSADGTWSFNASLEGRYGTGEYTEVRAKATAAKRF